MINHTDGTLKAEGEHRYLMPGVFLFRYGGRTIWTQKDGSTGTWSEKAAATGVWTEKTASSGTWTEKPPSA